MYAPLSAAIFLLCLISITAHRIYPTTEVVHRSGAFKKCCITDYAFNEDLECVHAELNKLSYTTHDAWQTISSQHPQQITTVIASMQGLSCDNEDDTGSRHHSRDLSRLYSIFYAPRDYCIENMINGTTVLIKCADAGSEMTLDRENSTETTVVMKTTTTTTTTTTIITVTTITTITTISVNASSKEDETVGHHCSDLRSLIYWGAQTFMDTNVAHVVLSTIVVVVYLSIPELGRSIYNRSVLRHNICLLLQGCLLTFLGYCNLCGVPMSDDFETFLWILMQYFTNATVFWLNVICFDMALSITRFRWMMGQQMIQEKNRRLLLYGVFAWGGAFLPAIVAVILEFYPGIPEDLPLKPNYRRYHDGPNYVVNIYFFGIPLLTLFWNNVLFVFTTYKIIRIQRSTEIATRNQTNVLRKKYFLFLQLYLLMGAPWFFGLLFARLNKLVVMKICRLIWPILWLLMLASHKKLRRKLVSKLRYVKKKPEIGVINL